MAWPNRDIDYKTEFGVESKEQLLARLAKVSELETANTTLKTQLDTQAGEVNTVKATLTALEAKFNERVEPVNNNNGNNNNNNTVEIPSVVDNEDGAFAVRMAPLYKRTLETTAMVTEDQMLRRIEAADPRFKLFEKEVREMLGSCALQQRANTDINPVTKRTYAEDLVQNCYLVVKGKYSDRILQDTMAGKGDFFVEPARSSGNTGTTSNQVDPTVLTDEDRRVIAKMGVSEKVYQQILKDGGPNMGGALSNKTSL